MNTAIRKALLLDAFYQVLDNKIFRLLFFLVLFVVCTSFVIGFREDRIDILFGLQSVTYEDFLGSFGLPATGAESLQSEFLGRLQGLIVNFLGGAFGMVFCVSATAFFVPRMLEKGSADIVFSKPVSRLTLMLSRYMAGILFVVILAVVLVGGVYLGLALGSGYHDPAFLWNVLTLVYLYALLHSVSLLVGVVTRSTVATILIAVVFFVLTGCEHRIWISRVWYQENKDQIRTNIGGNDDAAEDDGDDEVHPFLATLLTIVDVSHYVLPKTTDAKYVSQKLRELVEPGPDLVDGGGTLSIDRLPRGLRDAGEPHGAQVDLARRPATWALNAEGSELAQVELSRATRMLDDPDRGTRRASLPALSKALSDEVASRTGTTPVKGLVTIDGVSAAGFSWTEDGAPRRTVLVTYGDWSYRIDLTRTAAGRDELVEQRFEELLAGIKIQRDAQDVMDPNTWYENRFGWAAPLSFNVFFSIGSSLAFALIMLALAWWRLSRIDF